MRGAIEWNHLPGLSRNRDQVTGSGVIDKESVSALAYRQVYGLISLAGQFLQVLVGNADEHRAPVVVMRETPERRPENVILAARGIRQKPAPLQSIRQPEHTTAVDA